MKSTAHISLQWARSLEILTLLSKKVFFLLTVTLQVFKIRKRGKKILKVDNKRLKIKLRFVKNILGFQEIISSQR